MEHVEIRLSGSGGQGLILGALVLSDALSAEGYQVAHSQAFEPVSRGGVSRSDLVVDRRGVDYPLATALDMLLVLDACAAGLSLGLLRSRALVLVDQGLEQPPAGAGTVYRLPLIESARGLGNARVTNMAALGALARLGQLCRMESLRDAVRRTVPAAYVEISLRALAVGEALASAVAVPPHPANDIPATAAASR